MNQNFVLSHWDADGLISYIIFIKSTNLKPKVYFIPVGALTKSLCFLLNNSDKANLYIFDISASQKAIKVSSAFEKVLWIDHHVSEKIDQIPSNVEFVLDEEAPSAAHVVAKYFNFNDEYLVNLANEIDTNNIKSEEGFFLRDLTNALKWKYAGILLSNKFRSLAKQIISKGVDSLQTNESLVSLVNEYRKRNENLKEEIRKKIEVFELEGRKIAIIETTFNYPMHLILEVLEENYNEKFDVVASLNHKLANKKIITRMELRTQTDKPVIEIALQFNGGGHKKACGATLDRFISSKDFLEILKPFIEKGII